ncbi:MAG: aminotransferase class V-fold PLP-dependent enzyme [Thermodesulfobacteriota bacterium]
MIYFDNSATSWPKPPQVKEAINKFIDEIGANPGRSGHLLSIEAAKIIFETRDLLAKLFNIKDSSRIVFTTNATESINLALKGLLQSGDHVVTSSMEHNSVMRPLRDLEKKGVRLSIAPCSSNGELDPKEVEKRIQSNTKMIVLTHASNVTGTLLPIPEVGKIAKQHDIFFLVDAAQTAGSYPIDIETDGVDLLAFSGHKSLYGPQGTGGLVIGERIDEKKMIPLKQGGTGSRSEFEEQPDFLPDRFESGTPNTVGIAGLLEGVRFVLKEGVLNIHQYERSLIEKLAEGLLEIPKIKIYGWSKDKDRIATLSFNYLSLSSSEVASHLEECYGILCRPGLHCAPSAHKTIGTFPEGTVRFGLGYFNKAEEIEFALKAIRSMKWE